MTSQVLFEDGDDGETFSIHYRVEMNGGPDDYFGLCPECGKPPMMANVGRDHWAYCKDHKVTWCVGSNLFSSWRDQTKEQTEANRRFLADFKVIDRFFKVIEPFAPSDEEVDLEVKGFIESLEQDGNPFSQDAPDWATLTMAGDDPNRPIPPVDVVTLRRVVADILQEADDLLGRQGHDVKADDVLRIFGLGYEIRELSEVLVMAMTANEILGKAGQKLCERAWAMAEVFGTRPVSPGDFFHATNASYSNILARDYGSLGLVTSFDPDDDIPF